MPSDKEARDWPVPGMGLDIAPFPSRSALTQRPETQCRAPIRQNEDDVLVARDDSGTEFIEIMSVIDESVRQMGKLIQATHTNQVRSKATCSARDMVNDVPPEVGRSCATVEKEHDRLLV